MTDDRYSRQADLVPTDKLQSTRIGIAGCGAIGRQLAIQLAAMGAGSLFYTDFDTVESVNLGNQGWSTVDVGRSKVDALTDQLLLINPDMSLDSRNTRFPASAPIDALFLCVDTMAARRLLFESYDNIPLIIDARMAADTIRVLTLLQPPEDDDPSAPREQYENTLFTDAEAFQGTCTTKGTIYMANMAAALMVRQYVAWLRAEPFATDLTLAMASMELTTNL